MQHVEDLYGEGEAEEGVYSSEHTTRVMNRSLFFPSLLHPRFKYDKQLMDLCIPTDA